MKKRILSYITAFMMAVAIISAGTVSVSAAVTEGGMAWSYKCPASGSISGVDVYKRQVQRRNIII